MANNRLAFGGVKSSGDFFLHIGTSSSTQFIRFNCNTNNASNVLTNVVHNNYNELELIQPGQFVYIAGVGFTGNRSRITSVDLGNNTITIEDIPSANLSRLGAIQLPKGQIFVESGSLISPSNAGLTFRNITGSEDIEYSSGDAKWGTFLELAPTSSLGNKIAGKFSQYEITKITNRTGTSVASFYATSSTSGVLQEPPGETAASSNLGIAVFEFSKTSSLGPMFSAISIDGSQVNEASGFAAYQIAVQDLFDRTATGSGAGSGFPFTGSAQITGSLSVTGSSTFELNQGQTTDFFLIKSSSFSSLKVNSDGVVTFGNFNSLPTAVSGGMAYSGSNFYVGIE